MRHKKGFNHLGRTSAHRNAMLSNMAASLIIHKRISTTIQKAKALRSFVEPLITKSKDDNTHSRRVVFSYLQNKEAVNQLFREISEKIVDRPGGYTRILKTGVRSGDDAQMCIIELVDYNEVMLGAKEDGKASKKTRRGRSKKADEIDTPKAQVKNTPKESVKTATSIEENPSAEPIDKVNKVNNETNLESDKLVEEVKDNTIEDVKEDAKEDGNPDIAEDNNEENKNQPS